MLEIVHAQLERGDVAKAKTTLSQASLDYPVAAADDIEVPTTWYRLKEPEKVAQSLKALIESQHAERNTMFIDAAYESLAFACLEHKDIEQAQEYFNRVRSKSNYDLIKFSAKKGDFDEAARIARIVEDKLTPGGIVPAERRIEYLRKIAVAATRAGKKDTAEALLIEAAELKPPAAGGGRLIEEFRREMEVAGLPFAAGDLDACLKLAENADNLLVRYVTSLLTAIEIHVRRTGKRNYFFIPDYYQL